MAIPALAPVSRPGFISGTEDRVIDGTCAVERALVELRVEKVVDSVTGGNETTVIITTDGVITSPDAVGVGVTMPVIISVSGSLESAVTTEVKKAVVGGKAGVAIVFVAREWLRQIGCPYTQG
jgi:hypothetical protein